MPTSKKYKGTILNMSLDSYLDAPVRQIKHRVNSARERLAIALRMAEATRKMHKKNEIHRDIRPENFLYNKKTNHVKLVGSVDTDNFMSAPNFTAPEINSEKPRFSKASDIYALGISLQELFELHEKMGPNPGNPHGIMEDVHGHEKLPKSSEKEMISLIKEMISGDPKKRGDISEIVSRMEVLKNKYERNLALSKLFKQLQKSNPNLFLSDKFYKNYDSQQKKRSGFSGFFSKSKPKNPKTEKQLKEIQILLIMVSNDPSVESIKQLYDGLEAIKKEIEKSKQTGNTLGSMVDKLIQKLDAVPEFELVHKRFASYKPLN